MVYHIPNQSPQYHTLKNFLHLHKSRFDVSIIAGFGFLTSHFIQSKKRRLTVNPTQFSYDTLPHMSICTGSVLQKGSHTLSTEALDVSLGAHAPFPISHVPLATTALTA